MLLLLIVLSLAVLVFCIDRSPSVRYCHASRAGKSILPKFSFFSKMPLAGFIRDIDGDFVLNGRNYIAAVRGDSMVKFGLRDGMKLIVDVVDAPAVEIQNGDFVVVNAAAPKSDTGDRLRRVKWVRDGVVGFYEDSSGQPKDRSISEIDGKVTHVIK